MYEKFAEQIIELDQKDKAQPQQPVVNEQVEEKAEETVETQEAVAPEPTPAPEPEKVEAQVETEQTEETEQIQKEWYDLEDDAQKEAVTPEPVVAEPEPEVVMEEEDEDVKLLREFKKSGKSLRDFITEVDVPDYKSMSDADIIKKAFEELENMNTEELSEAMDELSSLTLFQRKKLAQDYRNQFLLQSDEKLKRLSSTLKPQEDQTKEVLSRFQTELDQTLKQVSGKEVYGLKVTDEMSNRIKNYLSKEIKMNRADGSIDVDLFVDFATWRLYGKDIVRTNVTKAKNDGRKELLIATTNPSSGSGPSNMSGAMKSNALDDAFSGYIKNKNF